MHALRRQIQPLFAGALAVGLFAALAAGGDALAHALGLPLPGAVLGMTAYGAGLAARPRWLEWTRPAARWLAGLLGALIVPAAVDLALFGPLLRTYAWQIGVTLTVVPALAAVVTAGVYQRLAGR